LDQYDYLKEIDNLLLSRRKQSSEEDYWNTHHEATHGYPRT
jgi:hypothetical protein